MRFFLLPCLVILLSGCIAAKDSAAQGAVLGDALPRRIPIPEKDALYNGVYQEAAWVLKEVSPSIPEEIWKKLAVKDGYVEVTAVIDQDGVIRTVESIKSSQKELEPYVTDALRQWKFKPAVIDHKPVRLRISQPFYLKKEEQPKGGMG